MCPLEVGGIMIARPGSACKEQAGGQAGGQASRRLVFGRRFDFAATHNAAAAAVSLGIAWMHGDVQEQGGPTPVEAWSTMEVIKIRATPRD